MGRSTETFSKKEREKKKLKKQLDKKEKAEERKANGDKGKGLEEMMAYVDENGNITSTPPDATKRKQVAVESIQISTSKQEDIEVEVVRNGVVSFFNESKGFGFIKDLLSQESIFVHVNGLLEQIGENDKVTFETEQGQKGLNAIKVKKTVK
ncbi:MAG: cold shock domain-containing protein [Mucilaginibacter sp.]